MYRSLITSPMFIAAGALTLMIPASDALGSGLIVTSDSGTNRIRISDPEQGKVVYDLPIVDSSTKGLCGVNPICFPLGIHHVVHNDRDYLDVAGVRWNGTGGEFYLNYPAAIARFELTANPRPVFRINRLDFRGLPERGAFHCAAQTDDLAFGPLSGIGCGLQFVHGFDIIEDAPAQRRISMAIADLANFRVLGVTLNYAGGNDIATVDWVIGMGDPGWPAIGFPNAVKYFSEPDGNYVLVTFHTDSGEPDFGAGSLVMFKEQADGSFAKQWRFPEPDSAETPNLYAAHMGQILTDPTSGDRWLIYAHGRGLADNWGGNENVDVGGSVGVLRLGETLGERPEYLVEGVPNLGSAFETPTLRYARDADFTTEGKLLITDASCETGCLEPAQHFLITPFYEDMEPSPLAGNFSSTHENQRLLDLPEEPGLTPIRCGHQNIFESEWIELEGLGRHLRAARDNATVLCSDESGSALIKGPSR